MKHNILLYIGIDVSKDKHDICIKSNDGNVLKRFQIKNTNKDLNKLYTTVDKLKSNAGENTDICVGIGIAITTGTQLLFTPHGSEPLSCWLYFYSQQLLCPWL